MRKMKFYAQYEKDEILWLANPVTFFGQNNNFYASMATLGVVGKAERCDSSDGPKTQSFTPINSVANKSWRNFMTSTFFPCYLMGFFLKMTHCLLCQFWVYLEDFSEFSFLQPHFWWANNKHVREQVEVQVSSLLLAAPFLLILVTLLNNIHRFPRSFFANLSLPTHSSESQSYVTYAWLTCHGQAYYLSAF